MKEIIVQASHKIGAWWRVSKCAETVFKRERGERGRGIFLEERIETMDPNENEVYKFLGVEQAEGIKTKVIFDRVKSAVKEKKSQDASEHWT